MGNFSSSSKELVPKSDSDKLREIMDTKGEETENKAIEFIDSTENKYYLKYEFVELYRYAYDPYDREWLFMDLSNTFLTKAITNHMPKLALKILSFDKSNANFDADFFNKENPSNDPYECMYKLSALYLACINKYEEVAEIIFDCLEKMDGTGDIIIQAVNRNNNSNGNINGKYFDSVFMMMCKNGWSSLVLKTIKYTSDKYLGEIVDGYTPLMHLCINCVDSTTAAIALIKTNKSNHYYLNSKGISATSIAFGNYLDDIVKLLKEMRSDK